MVPGENLYSQLLGTEVQESLEIGASGRPEQQNKTSSLKGIKASHCLKEGQHGPVSV